MDALILEGPARLAGTVAVSGSKNTALPLLFASLLFDSEIRFENVPRLWDVETTLKLLESMGARHEWNREDGVVVIEPTVANRTAHYDWVRKMRAGILALGPLVARYGEAQVSLPGGCAIGARPVDFHTAALEKMGVRINVDNGYIHARVEGRLRGAEIDFPLVSVTGTENVMMAAARAEGTTVLRNAAREPEVVALGELLQSAGLDVEGLGTDTIVIHGGVPKVPAKPVRVPPDRIETGTWIAAAVATRSALTIERCDASQQTAVIDVFRAMGAGIAIDEDGTRIHVTPTDSLRAIEIETEPFPGFATDMQAQLLVAACTAHGKSAIRETIFENRFMHVAELKRLGADIELQGNLAIVTGGKPLRGAPLMATDLRASACLVIAGLVAEGTTKVSRIYHLDRGYQRLDDKLLRLGAKIARVTESA